MKICAINIMHANSEMHKKVWMESCRRVACPGTEIVYKDTKAGTLYMPCFGFGYSRMLNAREIVEAMLEAEKEGCDAVFHDCTLDAGCLEAQEVVTIPVIPVSEASLKYCTLLGQRIGVVTLCEPRWVHHYMRMIRTYGLEGLCITNNPVRSVDITTDVVISKGMQEPQMIVDAVRKVAEGLAEDGAEAIQIGCGLFAPICTMAGLVSVKNGLVPLVDPLLVGLKTAEMAVIFKQGLGTPFRSGNGCCDAIPTERLNRLRSSYGLAPVTIDRSGTPDSCV